MPLTIRMITTDDLRDYAQGHGDAEDREEIEALIREDPRAAAIVLDALTGSNVRGDGVTIRNGALLRAIGYSDERPGTHANQSQARGRETRGV